MDNTFKTLEDYLTNIRKNYNTFPNIVSDAVNTLPSDIPFKLKVGIALSELTTLASHLRKSIELHDGTLVPVNAITFILSGSGTSKDRSLNTIRNALKDAYTSLENTRSEYAEKKAKGIAKIQEGKITNWKKYYEEPKPLQAGLGTVEGLVKHFSSLKENPLGAGSILSTEIGNEILSNGDLLNIVKLISIGYDLGNIQAKIVKSTDNQSKTITNLPINALFFGSQEAILFNSDVKHKFKLMFNTQLARRTQFIYTPEKSVPIQIKNIDEIHLKRKKEREVSLNAQRHLNALTKNLVEYSNTGVLTVPEDTMKIYDIYTEYNNILSENIPKNLPLSRLSRKHKQWLALKYAGMYCLYDNEEEITEKHYILAINTVEYLEDSLEKFEHELVKEPYEQFVEMCKHEAFEDSYTVSLHRLKKLGYISGSTSSKVKLEELTKLANSCDLEASYSCTENSITYKKIVKTDTVGVSYLLFDSSLKDKKAKEYMKRNCYSGFEFEETDFSSLKELLYHNAAYTCFKFKDGVRNKDNIESGTKFIVLDIDKTKLTDKEAHLILEEYNHYIVRTSDPDNQFKYRVLLELDSILDISNELWKEFLKALGDHLGFIIDILPKSQIFFSFSGRKILENTEGVQLSVKPLLDTAINRLNSKPKKPVLSPKDKRAKLDNKRETFNFAYEAEVGERSRKLYGALADAISLGCTPKELEELALDINSYWTLPMEEERLYSTLINPAKRRI